MRGYLGTIIGLRNCSSIGEGQMEKSRGDDMIRRIAVAIGSGSGRYLTKHYWYR